MDEVLDLTIDLCRRPSVTPDDAGCQALVAARLQAAGFAVESLRHGAVDNLWATHGSGGPVLVFLGHTDVVPPGPLDRWSSAPFEPTLRDGLLYARGAADMKGNVAAMTLALCDFVAAHPRHPGTVALLLTSDEEGEAVDGVRRVAEEFTRRGQRIDWCVVGEPSAKTDLGDVIRVGRRGSLHGHLVVRGVQGHVAYPQMVVNPIHRIAPALAELAAREWDAGNALFPPTSFQVSNIHAGTGTYNVVPGELALDFNFRFGTASTAEGLMQAVEAVLVRHDLDYAIRWELSGAPFATAPGLLTGAVRAAIREVTGIEAVGDTGGGTSDGRFIAPLGAQVVEVGPVNASIHKIDEHVRVDDLPRLRRIHRGIVERLLL
ncbi:MAG: succinyl-diaminopimelate desuccinylase [Xanthomonadaceae bacterium]|jgi:succinyl-diaminopimelate desuccinylase|nr:succinyl-diaminopimelate desuccinylase [Xanthomonadaceae bacterium]